MFVLLDKVGEDKIDVFWVYGVEVVVMLILVVFDSLELYYSVSDWLVWEIFGVFKLN